MLSDHTTATKAYQTPYNNYGEYVLGLHKSASPSGVLSELCRTPMNVKAWARSISYWHRLETNDNGPILNDAYLE